MMRTWLGLAAAGLSLAGCASEYRGLAPLPEVAASEYRLGPGDELRVSVFGLDAVNNTYIVSDTGAIALPLLEPIAVSGETVREAERAIAAEISRRQLVNQPRVSAQVQSYRPFFITGQVQKPGQYAYVPGMTLMTAVSIAGGYTFRADTDRAVVRRGGSKGVAQPDARILPGDVVTVAESTL
ncbi:polysaccharide biosynthesis/export family protein [Sphingomonas citri]|uniref:Polysaccharide export protein n=1 Tax=Sphingomonas citri TaxID=2862499 RepID=A0ABS7BJW4_9SPHN|nr:polysaccharide biosynthesis/export family protein [Sphingomonas citri]MBW6529896.1 polysaccharide export protein [Sphingomonas citri]